MITIGLPDLGHGAGVIARYLFGQTIGIMLIVT